MPFLRRFLMIAVVGMSGCVLSSDTGSVEVACERICDCALFSPTTIDACTDQCIEDVGAIDLPQACVDCFTESACTLIEAGVCDSACSIATNSPVESVP